MTPDQIHQRALVLVRLAVLYDKMSKEMHPDHEELHRLHIQMDDIYKTIPFYNHA